MVVVPLQKSANDADAALRAREPESTSWIQIASGATLIAGGLLLLTGNRRAGTVAAASGAALALLDQQEALRSCWNALPVYIDEVQRVLNQVQDTIEDVAAHREKLHRIMAR
ncbi:MAG: hypothetical protein P4K97_07265 [Terracidiphilus sp.]|nr:hypothetical protein [Terracidiphilus sp.]